MRLIDGDELKLKLPNTYHNGFENCRECRLLEREEVYAYIDRMPTVDAAPVVHGRWMKGGYACGENEYTCSVCGKTEWRTGCKRMKYCMYCGAKMDLEDEQ